MTQTPTRPSRNGTGKRHFSPILTSAPVVPPFAHSDYGQMAFSYDTQRCLELEDPVAYRRLVGDLLDAGAVVMQEGATCKADWDAAGGLEAPAPATAAYEARMAQLSAATHQLTRDLWVRVIGYCVSGVAVWPFDDPEPRPDHPESWALFADPVLDWLAGPALGLVREQIRSPKSASSSSPGLA